jgi:hypothetical protein
VGEKPGFFGFWFWCDIYGELCDRIYYLGYFGFFRGERNPVSWFCCAELRFFVGEKPGFFGFWFWCDIYGEIFTVRFAIAFTINLGYLGFLVERETRFLGFVVLN